MSFEEFRRAIASGAAMPNDLAGALAGLWREARGDWEGAHTAAQSDSSVAGAWVHAYLHRKEGDRSNASYWYSRAGKSLPAANVSFETEWAEIARALLEA